MMCDKELLNMKTCKQFFIVGVTMMCDKELLNMKTCKQFFIFQK